jgi:DNA mismatch repair protein PMS2
MHHYQLLQLKEMGSESIEVSDNGCGIDPSNYANIALKHHTSKLSNFNDLNSVASFGFRGEALNALCELSGKSFLLYVHSIRGVKKLMYLCQLFY